MACRPRMSCGWVGWAVRSTTCSSASSAYRLSSSAASRSSMARRKVVVSNAWWVWVFMRCLLGWGLAGFSHAADDPLAASIHRQGAGEGAYVQGPGAAAGVPHVPTMTTAMLEIRVIGELEVRLAGTKAELPASRRARALLGWLA